MLLLLTLSLALLNPIKIGLNHVQIVIGLHLCLLAGDGGWRLTGLPLKGLLQIRSWLHLREEGTRGWEIRTLLEGLRAMQLLLLLMECNKLV